MVGTFFTGIYVRSGIFQSLFSKLHLLSWRLGRRLLDDNIING